jgi:hypothetical protein
MADEIGTDLVAAWADARTDGRDHIFRIRSKPRCQGPDGDHGCARRGALPASVNGRNGSGSAIDEENRHAVGRSHADGDGRIVADGDIGFGPVIVPGCWETRIPFSASLEHIDTVQLTHAHEGIELDPQGVRKIRPACHAIRANLFEFQFARAEAMTRHGGQGPAA